MATATAPRLWPAPAKLNRFLHITGRRPDGYHLLQTVFQFLDVADDLEVTVTDEPAIVCEHVLAGVDPPQDLVWRAAQRLQQAAGIKRGARLRLIKRLPLGAGLGGGSSDAATTLVALNRLWGLDWPAAQLAELGLALGADVPVFVHGRAAWAEGVGERLTPIALDEPWYLVIVPPVRVSTAEIFGDSELTRNSPAIKIADFLSGAGRNDCEAVVTRRYPEVGEALAWLRERAPGRLTGTGSCVFAPFPDRAAADAAHAQLPTGWTGFVSRGLNRSPLLDVN